MSPIDRTASALLKIIALGAVCASAGAWYYYEPSETWLARLAAVSCSVALASTGLSCLRPDFRTKGALAVLVTLLCTVAVNTALTVFPSRTALEVVRDTPGFDTRDKLTVTRALRATGLEAYPASPLVHSRPPRFSAQEEALLPLSNIARVTTVLCNESGQYLIYTADRYGFNNSDDIYDRTGPRLVLAGDSFTHGWCVQPGEDVSSRLRARGFNAISLGITGNGPLLELGSLAEYGAKLSPAVVLWLYYEGNDLGELDLEHEIPLLRKYLRDGFDQDLIHRQPEVDRFWKRVLREGEVITDRRNAAAGELERRRVLKSLVFQTPLRRLVGLARPLVRPTPVPSETTFARFQQVLARATELSERAGADFYFVYLPTGKHFLEGPSEARTTVLALVEEMGISLIDFAEMLSETGDPMHYFPFRMNLHYTAEGYELLAEAIAAVLNDNGRE